MTIKRAISEHLEKISKLYPVITITGPRQSGKTTIAKDFFSDKDYVNLEHPKTREFAKDDPEAFLAKYPNGAILDEIQRVPELLSYIQVIVDESKKKSMFVLTGSQQFSLMRDISQSLAGRTSVISLLPFSLDELKANYLKEKEINTDQLMINGFYPKIYDEKIEPKILYRDYLRTYIERDLRQISEIKNLDLFQKFIRLCAGRVGQIFNASNLGDELGVSYNTVREWLSILQASYIVYTLPAFSSGNIKKQIIKAPKIFFYDVGLCNYLLDIYETKQLETHPLRGNIFENLVVSEILKFRYNEGEDPNLYFYRDRSGKEVDLIYKLANKYMAIEIKSGKTFHNDFLKNLDYFEALVADSLLKKVVIFDGESQKRSKFLLSNYQESADIFTRT